MSQFSRYIGVDYPGAETSTSNRLDEDFFVEEWRRMRKSFPHLA